MVIVRVTWQRNILTSIYSIHLKQSTKLLTITEVSIKNAQCIVFNFLSTFSKLLCNKIVQLIYSFLLKIKREE